MMTLRLAELAQVLDARLIGDDGEITVVSTDTRTLGAGALFVALRGERFDAHDFCEQAVQAGASALLVERELPLAIGQASKQDIILVAGKGHEDYQIIGTDKRHYSDRETVAAALHTLLESFT